MTSSAFGLWGWLSRYSLCHVHCVTLCSTVYPPLIWIQVAAKEAECNVSSGVANANLPIKPTQFVFSGQPTIDNHHCPPSQKASGSCEALLRKTRFPMGSCPAIYFAFKRHSNWGIFYEPTVRELRQHVVQSCSSCCWRTVCVKSCGRTT